MSRITNVMISVGSFDIPTVDRLNAWLQGVDPARTTIPGNWGTLKFIAEQGIWGGSKAPECNVFAGALNHADVAEIIKVISETYWYDPNQLQLFIQDQDQGFFRMWMIRDNEIRQYTPEFPSEHDDGFWSDGPGSE